jgi:hypothetical protein
MSDSSPSKKSSSVTFLAIAAVIIVGTILLNLSTTLGAANERIGELELRLTQAEEGLKILDPVKNVIINGAPVRNLRPEGSYQAIQATGVPNPVGEKMDSPYSWCPAQKDAGPEWLTLTYDQPVETSTITIHGNYAPSAVIRIVKVTDGKEVELWSGAPSSQIGLPAPVTLQSIKLYLDTGKVTGWNQIDAVELRTADGKKHWATTATASSSWSK